MPRTLRTHRYGRIRRRQCCRPVRHWKRVINRQRSSASETLACADQVALQLVQTDPNLMNAICAGASRFDFEREAPSRAPSMSQGATQVRSDVFALGGPPECRVREAIVKVCAAPMFKRLLRYGHLADHPRSMSQRVGTDGPTTRAGPLGDLNPRVSTALRPFWDWRTTRMPASARRASDTWTRQSTALGLAAVAERNRDGGASLLGAKVPRPVPCDELLTYVRASVARW